MKNETEEQWIMRHIEKLADMISKETDSGVRCGLRVYRIELLKEYAELTKNTTSEYIVKALTPKKNG
jgi:hypothetical protein